MKKLLSMVAAVGLTATASTGVVACSVQREQSPVAGTVDDHGIMTSSAKMKLDKNAITFWPINAIALTDDTQIPIQGLALINTDASSAIKHGSKVSDNVESLFTVSYKDIKGHLNSTRDKLDKDLTTNVNIRAQVGYLEDAERRKTIVMNVVNVYDDKVNGKSLPIIVDLPRLAIAPQNEKPSPMPIPEGIKVAPKLFGASIDDNMKVITAFGQGLPEKVNEDALKVLLDKFDLPKEATSTQDRLTIRLKSPVLQTQEQQEAYIEYIIDAKKFTQPVKIPAENSQWIPDKPDHYVPGTTCRGSNEDLTIVKAEMAETGTIISVKLSAPLRDKIYPYQIKLTDEEGSPIKVAFVQSFIGDDTIDIVLNDARTKIEPVKVCVMGIKTEISVDVDMSGDCWNPYLHCSWENIWQISKYAFYCTWKAAHIGLKAATLLIPCCWPAALVLTAYDPYWILR